MNEQAVRTNAISAIVAALLQLFTSWQALFVTATEYEPSSMVWLSIGLDAGIAVAFGALFFQVLKVPPGTPWRAISLPAMAIASVLSILQLGIRFSSDHGWWTGHVRYSLS